MPEWNFLITIGFMMIALGMFVMVFWTIARSFQESMENRNEISRSRLGSKEKISESIKGGGVVMIGPLPIVFGTDKKYAILAMILAVVLMLLVIIFLK